MAVGGEVEGCPGFRRAMCIFGPPFIDMSPIIGYLIKKVPVLFCGWCGGQGRGGRVSSFILLLSCLGCGGGWHTIVVLASRVTLRSRSERKTAHRTHAHDELRQKPKLPALLF